MKVFAGRFILEKRIGKGGMGEVWLAKDSEFGDERALKFLPPEVASDPAAIGRLRREAKAGKKLTHPRIVKTDDFYVEGDYAAVAMAYVKGKTLGQLQAETEKGFFEPCEIESWLKDVCEALDYAHQEVGMVHRDLKPQNIIVEESTGNAMVMDFGIARRIAETHTQLTGKQDESGTLAYMSPQQLQGESTVPEDDIYSLGATIYELLTGTPPFFRGKLEIQIPDKIPASLGEHRIELAKEHLVSSGGDIVEESWEKTVRKCLSKKRGDRPQSCQQLWSMLNGENKVNVEGAEGLEQTLSPETALNLSGEDRKQGKKVWVWGIAALVCMLGVLVSYINNSSDNDVNPSSSELTMSGVAEEQAVSGGKIQANVDDLSINDEQEAKKEDSKVAALKDEYEALNKDAAKKIQEHDWASAERILTEMRSHQLANSDRIEEFADELKKGRDAEKNAEDEKQRLAKRETEASTIFKEIELALSEKKEIDARKLFSRLEENYFETSVYKKEQSKIERRLDELRKELTSKQQGVRKSNNNFEWEVVVYKGREYVTLKKVKEFYFFDKITRAKEVTLYRSPKIARGQKLIEVVVKFSPGSDKCQMNGVLLILSEPIVGHNNGYLLSKVDLVKLVDPVLRPTSIRNAKPFKMVVIDAGHGGKDIGNEGYMGSYEKDYTLAVSRLVRDELQKMGYKVVMTRGNDEFTSLDDRVKIANKYPDAIFVSVHFNSGIARESGLETYTVSPVGVSDMGALVKPGDLKMVPGNNSDSASIALATALHSRSILYLNDERYGNDFKIKDRGIKRARLDLLKGIKIPSVVIEGGFLSNAEEAKKIHSKPYKKALAAAIVRGINVYRKSITGKTDNSAREKRLARLIGQAMLMAKVRSVLPTGEGHLVILDIVSDRAVEGVSELAIRRSGQLVGSVKIPKDKGKKEFRNMINTLKASGLGSKHPDVIIWEKFYSELGSKKIAAVPLLKTFPQGSVDIKTGDELIIPPMK